MSILHTSIRLIVKVTDVLLMFLMGGIVTIIFVELLYRNIFNRSFRSAIEVSGILFIWMIFLGIIHLYDRGKLLKFEVLTTRIKGALLDVFWYLNKVVCLGLGVVIIIAFTQMHPFMSTRFYVTIPFLPLTMHYLPMLLAGAFLILKSIEELLCKTQQLIKKGEQ